MKTLSLLWIVLMAFTLIMGVPQGYAYKLETTENGSFLHWPSEAFPVSYRVTTTAPINRDAFIGAIQRSFSTWQGVKNAAITFQYAGNATSNEPAYDGVNNIITGKKVSGRDVIGQTYIYYTVDDGRILDADIVLNSSFKWATDGTPDKMDVQDAATHEIGHFCGLDDLYANEEREKTMYGYIDYGETKKRTLDPDDMAGLDTIYPQGSQPDDSGGGGSGCGTISPPNHPPGPNDINFLWLFLILALLYGQRFFKRPHQTS